MNQKGRDALRKAAMNGVKQIKGYYSMEGGVCALGVLIDDAARQGQMTLHQYGLDSLLHQYGLDSFVPCQICNKEFPESRLMVHYNDMHDLDFLGIAEKMPVSDA